MADQIEEVKQKTDIVDLIGSYIELKRAGRNYKANCPFHGERTPSFMVSTELQIYKCFGCGLGGDCFTFLEQYEGMEFGEALKFLADKAGIKLRPLSFKPKSEKEKIYQINSYAAKLYHHILKQPVGKVALNYLVKERGLTAATIETFQLGFSPNVQFVGRKFLVGKNKIPEEELVKAGLVYKGRGGVYDRFRGRIIFPLYDHRSNVIGFAGRILPGSREDLAKYINTPETPVYNKGSVLYGLNLTRSEIKRANLAIVVEGELDLISCYQAGIRNVVALKGTAMTQDQVKLLSRYSGKITLALDADLAGDMAARRGITIAANVGLEVGVVELKDYKDPDDAARSDPKGFKKMLARPVGVWDFIIDSVFSRHNARVGMGKARISQEISPILAQIEDSILKAHYAQVVADRLEVPLEAVITQIERSGVGKKVSVKEDVRQPQGSRQELLEKELLSLAFQLDPEYLLKENIENLVTTQLSKRILEEYGKFRKTHKKFNISAFVKILAPELREGFSEAILMDLGFKSDSPDDLQRQQALVTKELEKLHLKDKRLKLSQRIKILERDKDTEALYEAEKSFAKLSSELAAIEEK